MSQATFERLSAEGRAALLAGENRFEVPPFDGGRRWGLAFIFRPERDLAEVLDDLTTSALALAGEEHWDTASTGCAHMTIRGLEPHRVPIPPDDPTATRYADALDRALRDQSPVQFALEGILITPVSVMVRAVPVDDGADRVWPPLERELGDDGWFEADYGRDIWYFNLVHFSGPLARPEGLAEWVQARSALSLGTAAFGRADLVSWEFDGRRVVPTVLAATALAG